MSDRSTPQQDVVESRLLVDELVRIGRRTEPGGGARWYLTRANTRAREIGETLSEKGGQDSMLAAHKGVRLQLGAIAARELEVAWDSIGAWAG